MKRNRLILAAFAAAATLAAFTGCKEDLTWEDASYEEYTKNFIEKFGRPEEGHQFSMATRNKVTVHNSEPKDVDIIAEVSGKKYCFATYQGISGTTDIKFTIPKGVEEVFVYFDNQMYPVKVGASIDLDNINGYLLNRLPAYSLSRADHHEYWGTNEGANIHGLIDNVTNGHFTVSHAHCGWPMSIWELTHYINDLANQGKGSHSNEMHFHVGDSESFIGIEYWDKTKIGCDIEIGIMNTANNQMYPFYCTKDIKDGNVYGWHDKDEYHTDADNVTGEITLNFNPDEPEKGSQSQLHVAWNDVNYFHRIATVLYMDIDLMNALNDYVTVQAKFPTYQSMQSNNDATYYGITIPAFNPDPANGNPEDEPLYARAYEAYLYAWAHDSANQGNGDGQLNASDMAALDAINNFIPIKEYWITHDLGFYYGNSYPTFVTKNGNSYTIRFNGAARRGNNYHTRDYGDYLIDPTLPGETTFWNWGSGFHRAENSTGDDSTDYILYVKDADTGTVIATSASGNGKIYSPSGNYICTNPHTGIGTAHLHGWDLNGDGSYNDLIMYSAIPGNSAQRWDFEPFTWIIAAEDLGSTDDWDFNDVVVGISFEDTNATSQEITVKPLAAGGIYPAYLVYSDNGKDYIVGEEIHFWLGQTSYEIYNTGSTHITDVKNRPVAQWTYSKSDHEGQSFSISGVSEDGVWAGTDLNGFSIYVDKEKRYTAELTYAIYESGYNENGFTNTENTGWKKNTTHLTFAGRDAHGVAPMMIIVGGDWEWPSEREHIYDAYPGWYKWIDNSTFNWYDPNLTGEDAIDRNRVTKHKE